MSVTAWRTFKQFLNKKIFVDLVFKKSYQNK